MGKHDTPHAPPEGSRLKLRGTRSTRSLPVLIVERHANVRTGLGFRSSTREVLNLNTPGAMGKRDRPHAPPEGSRLKLRGTRSTRSLPVLTVEGRANVRTGLGFRSSTREPLNLNTGKLRTSKPPGPGTCDSSRNPSTTSRLPMGTRRGLSNQVGMVHSRIRPQRSSTV